MKDLIDSVVWTAATSDNLKYIINKVYSSADPRTFHFTRWNLAFGYDNTLRNLVTANIKNEIHKKFYEHYTPINQIQ